MFPSMEPAFVTDGRLILVTSVRYIVAGITASVYSMITVSGTSAELAGTGLLAVLSRTAQVHGYINKVTYTNLVH